MDTIFRRFSQADARRSDRSAGDRQRHRAKVRAAIRENIADIVAEDSIIGRAGPHIIKVPIRGIREYRFVYGEGNPDAATGPGGTQPGQPIPGRGDKPGDGGEGPGGDAPGTDYYETEITLDELVEVMFEDLALPHLERRRLMNISAERIIQRKGYRKVGIRAHLDKRRTARHRLRRKHALQARQGDDAPERIPFRWEDVTYRRLVPEPSPQSNAVVICIMDTSASMDTMKKYLARSFFFLLHQFVRTRYANVEVVFVAHHVEAREVTEQEFFHKGESGGTRISSGYRKALEIIDQRYHPSLWNIYAFHCSDGDNWGDDNETALRAAEALCQVSNLFCYGEIKPTRGSSNSVMLRAFKSIESENFQTLVLRQKEDIWPAFKGLLTHDRATGTPAA